MSGARSRSAAVAAVTVAVSAAGVAAFSLPASGDPARSPGTVAASADGLPTPTPTASADPLPASSEALASSGAAAPGTSAGVLARQGVASAATAAPFVLEAPTLDAWEPVLGPVEALDDAPEPGTPNGPLLALVRAFEVPVFERPGRRSRAGRLRRGAFVRVGERSRGRRCRRGRWYALSAGGYVCTSYGLEVSRRPGALDRAQRRAAVWRPLPFRYGQVVTNGAPRLSRLPTERELAAIDRALATGRPMPEPVMKRMEGDYYVSLDEIETVDGKRLHRTVRGQYVRAEDVEVLETPSMLGERLDDVELPLAFVYGGDVPIYRMQDGVPVPVGVARKHARFAPAGRVTRAGTELVKTRGGALVPAASIRHVEAMARPGGVPRGARWIHVDLSEQALVAYEGDRPVYATLISSGREGYETPTGLYRVRRKFLTKTMRGADVVDGVYDVEDVPWTLFYHGGYAVHGAYWHDDFGEVRSHGCTNVAPADARWLYYWSTPKMPRGWHAVHGAGTWVLFTD